MKSLLPGPQRRSIRIGAYDYSQPGAYFVTVCAHNRESLFGEVFGGNMCLNCVGEIVQEEGGHSSQVRDELTLDSFVVMPNHVHGIVIIDPVGATGWSPVGKEPRPGRATGRSPLHNRSIPARGPAKRSLAAFVAGFKSAVTKRVNEIRGAPGIPVWQRNYYEHVIRDEKSLDRIREYISTNAIRWESDRENPSRTGFDEFDQWLDSFKIPPLQRK